MGIWEYNDLIVERHSTREVYQYPKEIYCTGSSFSSDSSVAYDYD